MRARGSLPGRWALSQLSGSMNDPQAVYALPRMEPNLRAAARGTAHGFGVARRDLAEASTSVDRFG